jgi:hypothetical protein
MNRMGVLRGFLWVASGRDLPGSNRGVERRAVDRRAARIFAEHGSKFVKSPYFQSLELAEASLGRRLLEPAGGYSSWPS